jgi:hypothetical protein
MRRYQTLNAYAELTRCGSVATSISEKRPQCPLLAANDVGSLGFVEFALSRDLNSHELVLGSSVSVRLLRAWSGQRNGNPGDASK